MQWSSSLEAISCSSNWEIWIFYGNGRVIIIFARASWANWMQFTHFCPCSLISILMLPSYVHLGLSSGLSLSGFLSKTVYTFLIFPVYAVCPNHFILLDLAIPIMFCAKDQLWCSSLCSGHNYAIKFCVTWYLLMTGEICYLNAQFSSRS